MKKIIIPFLIIATIAGILTPTYAKALTLEELHSWWDDTFGLVPIVNTILDGFHTFWVLVLNLFAGILPTMNNPIMEFVVAFDKIISFGQQLSFIIPWPTIWWALIIMFWAEFAIIAFNTGKWVLKFLRG